MNNGIYKYAITALAKHFPSKYLSAIMLSMKLENEDALDQYVVCHECYTLHEEVPIRDGTQAICTQCGGVLYRYETRLIDYGLALSITGLIFFIVANLFPLVKIELLGHEQYIALSKTFISLFENEFYLVGLLCSFLIFIFPLMIFMINIVLFLLLKLSKGEKMTKELLVLISHIRPWSMSDIFLISILVALIKLIGYAQIEIGISFWALILFVLMDLYITKYIHISELWTLRKGIFEPKDRDD